MSKGLKITLFVILGLIIGIGSIYFFVLNSFDTSMDPVINNQIIEFEEVGEKVYMRAKTWGISGNHSEILLSTSPINNEHREYFKNKQYTFINTTELFYRKQGKDSLLIYVDYKSEIPEKLDTKIQIEQIELKNYDEVKDYKQNYKKYGLSKISVY